MNKRVHNPVYDEPAEVYAKAYGTAEPAMQEMRFKIPGMRQDHSADSDDVFVLSAPVQNVDLSLAAETMREQHVPSHIADIVMCEMSERLHLLMLADVLAQRMVRVG